MTTIYFLAATGLLGYGAYRVYHLPIVASSSDETRSLVSSDLNRFLLSDSDEMPSTVKQLAKIVQSDEVFTSISKFSKAMTVGIIRGMGSASESRGLSNKIPEKIYHLPYDASSDETRSLVSSDLNRFLLSDSDEIPSSVKQLAKIVQSDEVLSPISKFSEAMTVGIIQGMGSAFEWRGLSKKRLEKIFSSSGSGSREQGNLNM